MGFPAPMLFAWAAGLTEFGGGLLLKFGRFRQKVVHDAIGANCLLIPRACFDDVGLFDERRHPWAIVREGRIVSRASSGYPAAGSEEVRSLVI